MLRALPFGILVFTLAGLSDSRQKVERRDLLVESDAGVQIFVREVFTAQSQSGPAILLVHGARVPGLASFDLPGAAALSLPILRSGDLTSTFWIFAVRDGLPGQPKWPSRQTPIRP